MLHWWPDTSSVALTMSLQLTVTKVTFPGAIRGCSQLCMQLKQWIIVVYWADSLLASLVMSYVPIHHSKALINHYLHPDHTVIHQFRDHVIFH